MAGTDYEGENVRHLYGTALAVIMAAVMFFAGGWGYRRLLGFPVLPGQPTTLPAGGGSLLGHGTALLALAALVATAILAGLLVTVRRISPLAAALPGALLLGWTALYRVSVQGAVELIPFRSQAFGAGWEALLFNGILAAVGAVLILPALIPSRWLDARAATAGAPAQPDEQLTAIWPDARPRRPEEQPQDWQPQQPQWEPEPALTGTVLSYPANSSVRPVDTSRVTGASRALRATGSFAAVPGWTPRPAGPFRAADTGLLGRPYYQSTDQ